MVDAMVKRGMPQLGYNYLVLDDCWASHLRHVDGSLRPDMFRFPSGMLALTQYVHDHGMKLGLYLCAGTFTCKGHRPCSYGYYEEDAKTMAAWNVDFVKVRACVSE